MKHFSSHIILALLCFLVSGKIQSQIQQNPQNDFWDKVQFGGGLALSIGNNFTNIGVSPTAIYNFNRYAAMGVGLQYSYLKQKGFFESNMYGGSVIGLFNPVEQVQLSAELEQLRVNVHYDETNLSDDFWNTALFLGAGYRANNVIVGVRYNVLYQSDRNVYGQAWMPFVRVFF